MDWVPKEIEDYCIDHSTRPSPLARELEAFTRASVHGSQMLIGELEASFIISLLHLNRTKHVLELGTFTGYSALVMAEQIPVDGTVTTIDINAQTTKIAQEYWARSPHGKKIKLILKPGLEALEECDRNYDFIFIDADKNNYTNYLRWALKHLGPQGCIVVDNTIWKGKVLTPDLDKQTASICAHNDFARDLEGCTKTLLPIRDGMFLIQMRP